MIRTNVITLRRRDSLFIIFVCGNITKTGRNEIESEVKNNKIVELMKNKKSTYCTCLSDKNRL